MNPNKICVVTVVNDESVYAEMCLYLKQLQVPKDFELEFIAIKNKNIAQGYNQAMENSDAKYKIYLQSDVYIIFKEFIIKIIELFQNDLTIGMIGVTGIDKIPVYENLLAYQNKYGVILERNDSSIEKIENKVSQKIYETVQLLQGLVMATQYDIAWREELFPESYFYDYAQSLEFIKKGYKVIIPSHDTVWCLHDKPREIGSDGYNKYKKIFFEEYEDQSLKNSILDNYNYVQEIKKIIFQEKDLYEKIKLIHYLAVFANTSLCGEYCDADIERELYKISNCLTFKAKKKRDEKNAILHVMTEAYETGGHTRVVESMMKTDSQHRHFLILTNPNSMVPLWLKEAVEKSGGQIFFVQGSSFFEKSANLFEQSLPFDKLLLHIHNYDVVPVLAYANKAWHAPIYFLNHSDHLFWIGAGIADMVLNITEYAQQISVTRRNIKNNLLLYGPLQQKLPVIKDEKKKIALRNSLGILKNQKIITSMASDWRYTNTHDYNFPEFVLNILNQCPDVVFIIIGAAGQIRKWDLLRKNKRVIFPGTISKDHVSAMFAVTDLYVDSFYHSSGGCLVDAFLYGLPVLSLNCDRVDALKKFSRKTVPALTDAVLRFLAGEKVIDHEEEKKCYNKYYGLDAWQKKLKEIYTSKTQHTFHDIGAVPFRIEEMDINVARQFNASLYNLCPPKAMFFAENEKKIRELITAIFHIYYEI